MAALESFDAALASSSCPPGQAVQAVAPDGTATCAEVGGAGPVVPKVSGTLSQSLSGLLQLDAGDSIEVVAFQTSGSALTLSSTSPQQFAMVKVATVP